MKELEIEGLGDDAALRACLRRSRRSGRGGVTGARTRLLEEGSSVNRKRTQLLWREEGLRVPGRWRKRQCLGESTVAAVRLVAERPDHVWALDFQYDQAADGRILKPLHVVDEFTREALANECERRSDAESGSRVRDELLAVELFSCVTEAQVIVADWREGYNEHRRHSSLAMIAPARLARAWRQSNNPPGDHAARGTSLRSPPGLTPRGTAAPPTAVQPNPDHRLSQRVDR